MTLPALPPRAPSASRFSEVLAAAWPAAPEASAAALSEPAWRDALAEMLAAARCSLLPGCVLAARFPEADQLPSSFPEPRFLASIERLGAQLVARAGLAPAGTFWTYARGTFWIGVPETPAPAALAAAEAALLPLAATWGPQAGARLAVWAWSWHTAEQPPEGVMRDLERRLAALDASAPAAGAPVGAPARLEGRLQALLATLGGGA